MNVEGRKLERIFWEEIAKPLVLIKTLGQSHGVTTANLVLEGNCQDIDVEIQSHDALLILQHTYLRIEDRARGARLFKYDRREGAYLKNRVSYSNTEALNSTQRSKVHANVMEIWKHAHELPPEGLCNLILARGNLNRISMSDPEWFDFEFVGRLLKKLESPRHWNYAVLLLNNIINYEIKDGKNCYLMKQLKISYLDNNAQGKSPCIYRYVDGNHPKVQFKPYDFPPPTEEEETPEVQELSEFSEAPEVPEASETSSSLEAPPKKRKAPSEPRSSKRDKREKISWFNVWNSSRLRCNVYGVEFRAYSIADCPVVRDHRLNSPFEYKTIQDINVFTGYKWTYDEIKSAYESEIGKATVTRYLNCLFNVICDSNSEQYKCLVNTFAHFVQRPGVKTQYCVYVKGQKGIGKSLLLFTPFQQLFHQHSCYLAGELLADDFNGRLRDGVLLVNLDEFPQVIKSMQAFKSQITQDYMNVRPMFQEAQTIPNLMNFIITSNFTPSRQMEITNDERRFLLIEARKFDAASLKNHCASMTEFATNYLFEHGFNTGFKAICYHFLKIAQPPPDNMHLHIPVTPLMCKIIESNMPPMERAVKKWIEQGGIRSKVKDAGARYEYDWDNLDCGSEWTWKELREQACITLNEDRHNTSRHNVNNDIESLKQFVLTDAKTRQGGRKGEITQFKLLDRRHHYDHFRKFYPQVMFYWGHPSLILGEDLFTNTRMMSVFQDPVLRELKQETRHWSELDYQLAIVELKKALAKHGGGLTVCMQPDPVSEKVLQRVRLYRASDNTEIVEDGQDPQETLEPNEEED